MKNNGNWILKGHVVFPDDDRTISKFDNGLGYNDLEFYKEYLLENSEGYRYIFYIGGPKSCAGRYVGIGSWGGGQGVISVEDYKNYKYNHFYDII